MNSQAISNARAWVQTIAEAMAAFEALQGGDESASFDGEEFTSEDDLRQRIEEMPLSVQVREGWREPFADRGEPEEFLILLSTGGPALRIYGDIGGKHALQWQDWGTPWTDYHDTTEEQDKAISAFVGLFYLGE